MRTSSSRLMPVAGSKRERRARPELMTMRTPSMVRLVSAMLVGGAWWLFEWELAAGASLPEARTAAVNLFVAVQAFYLFNCRSLTESVWRAGFFSNRWVIVGVGVQAVAQLVLTYLPFMNRVFGTAPLDGGAWARIIGFAFAASLVIAVEKWLRRRRSPGSRPVPAGH